MSCEDGHRLGPPTRAQWGGGPLAGDWRVRPCLDCDAYLLLSASGGEAGAILVELTPAGPSVRPGS